MHFACWGYKNNLFWGLIDGYLNFKVMWRFLVNSVEPDPLDKRWKVRLTTLSHNLTLWDLGMWQTSDSDHPNLRSDGPSSLFLIAWSQVTTTPSTYLYWGHLALIPS